jgi:hypothetical protein
VLTYSSEILAGLDHGTEGNDEHVGLGFGLAGSSQPNRIFKAGIFFQRKGGYTGRGDLLFCVENTQDNTTEVSPANVALTISRFGEVSATNSLTAASFSGSGAGLTAIPAAQITGTLAVANGGTGVNGSTGTGDVVLSNAPAFSGDVAFDTNTLFVDSTNNRVGIGTTSPAYKLNILTDTNYDGISLRDTTRELLKIAKGNDGAYINMFESGVSKVNISTAGDSYFIGGNIGIGTASPGNSSKMPGKSLHLFDGGGVGASISGSIFTATNKPKANLLFQKYTATTTAAWGELTGMISLNWSPYRATHCYGVGMYCFRASYSNDDQANMMFYATNGGYGIDGDAIVIDGTGSNQTVVTTNGSTVTSDDRLKTGETLITSALTSIKKLRPQLYAKHPFYDSFSDLKPNVKLESGLIVQDVWYDAPEFRHLVIKDKTAIPAAKKPNEPIPGDITVDPDYSDWGVKPASLNYMGLIPYLISSIQELCDEIPHRKVNVPRELFSNVVHYHGLIVSKKDTIYLSSTVKDKSVYGVVSETQPKETKTSEIYVKSSGEGCVWIINTSNIEAGDYVTTSNIAGYGQRQDSEFLANYTVAKIINDCDFTPPNVPIKRVIQRLEDVNYWVFKHCLGLSKEVYDELPDKDRCIKTEKIYKLDGHQINPTTSNVFDSNTNTYSEVTLNPEDVPGAEMEILTQYCKIDRTEFKKSIPGLELEVRQEMVNVLDEHSQIQWEDHPTETEKAYKIRYLDANGVITDEANAVHTAAFVGCTYHCG